jgi:transglutaminase-like putative cysteine protease
VKIRIQHRTVYRYAEEVFFGPHRIMLRPREGHDIRIERSILEITPAHRLHWIRDVYGNSIGVITFTERASELMVYSELVLQHFETNPFDFCIEESAARYPFSYDRETFLELSALIQPIYSDDAEAVRKWLGQFWRPGQSIETLPLLQQINSFICRTFKYQIRDDPGVQSPAKTIELNSGSCRDFAALFIESCRCLELAARFVSGYVFGGSTPEAGASTHAWAEVYLPGGGWKGFDPTSGVLATSGHVPVAVARHPEQATPIAGSFIGPAGAFRDMEASVVVEKIDGSVPA